MKKLTLGLIFLLVPFICCANDYIDLVRNTLLENDVYTVEQIVNALSYGELYWTQNGNNVSVSFHPLAFMNEKVGLGKFTFSVSDSRKVKYESLSDPYGKTFKRSFNNNWKYAVKNGTQVILRKQKIYEIIQEVHEYIVYGERGDVNGDGIANCQDFSFMFKFLWDKYNPYEKADCEIVGNDDLLHAFNRVRIPYGHDLWEYIEPQAKVGSFEMPEAWGEEYNGSFNQYGDNMAGMIYPSNWDTISANSKEQFSKYGTTIKPYLEIGAEVFNPKWGFHGDTGMFGQVGFFAVQMFAGLSYRPYDIKETLYGIGIDLGGRFGAAFTKGSFIFNPFAGFEFGWDEDTKFNCAPQLGAQIAWGGFIVDAYYSFNINRHKKGFFSFGVGWMF